MKPPNIDIVGPTGHDLTQPGDGSHFGFLYQNENQYSTVPSRPRHLILGDPATTAIRGRTVWATSHHSEGSPGASQAQGGCRHLVATPDDSNVLYSTLQFTRPERKPSIFGAKTWRGKNSVQSRRCAGNRPISDIGWVWFGL